MIICIELNIRVASVGYDRRGAYEDSWCIGAVFVDIVRGDQCLALKGIASSLERRWI